jgi:hypothetical protein
MQLVSCQPVQGRTVRDYRYLCLFSATQQPKYRGVLTDVALAEVIKKTLCNICYIKYQQFAFIFPNAGTILFHYIPPRHR